jgi:hypothetical protein
MRSSSKELHQIIHAMSAAEKRFFHQYAQRHIIGRSNTYFQLYELLVQQAVYDEAAARSHLSMNRAHFAVLKHQLYELILEALSQLHREMNSIEKGKRLQQSIHILIEKGLIEQATRRLKKLQKLVKKEQLLVLQPEVLTIQRVLLERSISQSGTEQSIRQWNREWKEMLLQMEDLGTAAATGLSIAAQHYRKVRLRENKSIKEAEQTIEHENFQRILKHAPAPSRMEALRAASTHYFMKGASEKALHYNEQLIRLFNEAPHLKQLYPQRYVTALNNYLIDNFQLKNWETLQMGLEELRSLPEKKAFKRLSGIHKRIFEQSSLLQINMLITRKAYAEASEWFTLQQGAFRQYEGSLSYPNHLSLLYLRSVSHFMSGHFEHALESINTFLDLHKKNTLEELYKFGRLLQLLIHASLENFELLPYLIQSLKRTHQNFHPQSTGLLFSSLLQISHAIDHKARMKLYQSWQAQIIEKQLEKSEGRFYQYLDLVYWMEKMHHRPVR